MNPEAANAPTAWRRDRSRPIMRRSCVLALCLTAALGAAGCQMVMKAEQPLYPATDTSQPTALLRLDNRISDSMFSLSDVILIHTQIDGFAPVAKRYLPKGVTEIRLPVGSHALVHGADMKGNSPYHFNEMTMNFEVEAGKTYTVHFVMAPALMKPGYYISYEGWDDETIAQWPTENRIANPLF